MVDRWRGQAKGWWSQGKADRACTVVRYVIPTIHLYVWTYEWYTDLYLSRWSDVWSTRFISRRCGSPKKGFNSSRPQAYEVSETCIISVLHVAGASGNVLVRGYVTFQSPTLNYDIIFIELICHLPLQSWYFSCSVTRRTTSGHNLVLWYKHTSCDPPPSFQPEKVSCH